VSVDAAELAGARALFPVLDRHAYLNAGAIGPLSRASHEAMVEWQARGLAGGRSGLWEEGGRLQAQVLERLAALLAVPPDRLLLTTSTTEGCNLVVTGLRLGPDDEIVTTDAEHPGLEQPVRSSGARVRVAAVLGRPPDEVVRAVRAEVTGRTRLVALSHVLWGSGEIMPVEEIRRETGVPILVDGAQSAGAIAVQAAAADFYTVSAQKWLCAPEMTGALYVADDAALRPQMSGFAAAFREGVDRLAMTHQPVAVLAALLAALEQRPAWAFARAAEMTERCRLALVEAGFEVRTPPGQACLVAFSAPGGADGALARCLERDVVIRKLPDGWLRASCGWWTSDEDIARLIDAMSG
jgi:L-cysteine/cystine lyase